MNIAELFARIGLKTDEDKAKSFGRAMNTVKIGLIATTAVAAGTALAIRKITSEAMTAAVAFKQFEAETGASAQELQKWQAVAEQTNQSAESVSSAIKAIVANQEKIKLGQGDISGYQILGIDPRQDPFKILEDLRVKTKGLSDGMRKNILSQIGVGAGMLQTLNLTRKEFDEMAGRAWIISPQAIETLNQTKSSVDLAARSIKYMKAQIAVGLSPQIRETTKDFQAWMKVNEKGIVEGFKLGFKYLTMFTKAAYNAGSMIDRIVSSTIGWEMTIKGLIGVVIALNAALLLSPIGMIAAGFILLVAIMDDLYVYSQGGKSLFGEFMKEFPVLEKSILGFYGTLWDVLKLVKSFASGDGLSVKKITGEWGYLGEVILLAFNKMKDFIELSKKLKEKYLPEDMKEMSIGSMATTLIPGVEFIKALQEIILEISKERPKSNLGIKNGLKKGPLETSISKSKFNFDIKDILTEVIPGGGLVKMFQTLADKKSGPVTQNNDITMNITGNSDPSAVGDAAAKSIQRSINAASAQLPRDQ